MLMISSEDKRDYNVPISSLSPADVERPREHDRNIRYFLSSMDCISEVLHSINLDISFIWHAFIRPFGTPSYIDTATYWSRPALRTA